MIDFPNPECEPAIKGYFLRRAHEISLEDESAVIEMLDSQDSDIDVARLNGMPEHKIPAEVFPGYAIMHLKNLNPYVSSMRGWRMNILRTLKGQESNGGLE